VAPAAAEDVVVEIVLELSQPLDQMDDVTADSAAGVLGDARINADSHG
jgi:hypothetical protein